jgi:hypothetical protein
MSSEHYPQPCFPSPATEPAHMPPRCAEFKPDWVSTIPGLASVLVAQAGSDGSRSSSWDDRTVLRLVQRDYESIGGFAQRVVRGVKSLVRKHAGFQQLGVVVRDYFPAGSSARSDMIASIVLRLGSSPVPLTVRFLGVMESDRG